MADCCTDAACEIDKLRQGQRSTLKVVLAINLVMFVIEVVAGLLAGSTALLADSLDMLGDALVYGFSLYVVARSDAWKAGSALLKGGIMAASGVFALGYAVYKLLNPHVPPAETVGGIGLLALAANSLCLFLLWSHRAEDVNMRSVWLCSRNDIIANTSVLAAAGVIWLGGSQWPDLVVGVGIAALFLHSSLRVVQDAARTYLAHRRSLRGGV
ncbi:MAG: cation diffusion facilitator family transporter [Phycisphaerales bacterium]|jgi:cation diffusion facilitator family transporter